MHFNPLSIFVCFFKNVTWMKPFLVFDISCIGTVLQPKAKAPLMKF